MKLDTEELATIKRRFGPLWAELAELAGTETGGTRLYYLSRYVGTSDVAEEDSLTRYLGWANLTIARSDSFAAGPNGPDRDHGTAVLNDRSRAHGLPSWWAVSFGRWPDHPDQRTHQGEWIMNTLSITNDAGRPFTVRFLATGDAYGRTNSLTADKPLVEFFDATYADEKAFGPLGQFVSRYYVASLLGTDGYGRGTGGLDLNGGVPVWKVDAAAMATVRTWLTEQISTKTPSPRRVIESMRARVQRRI